MEVPSTFLGTGQVTMGEVFHIDDLLDFSNEDIAGPIGEGAMQVSCLESCGTATATVSSTCSPALTGNEPQTPPILEEKEHPAGELCVPCDDLAELEWLSKFVEDSFSMGEVPRAFSNCVSLTVSTDLQMGSYSNKDHFQSASPVSVLESSASSGRAGSVYREVTVPGRARSKRSRTGGRVWGASGILTYSSANDRDSYCNDSEIVRETQPYSPSVFEDSNTLTLMPSKPASTAKKSWKAGKGGKKGQDATQPWRCMHCATQRTPQWRAGPMGPKTLCNACGVRYKSGRLLPEYRPAGSPGYIGHKHSNSHKKILEMRKHKEQEEEEQLEDPESTMSCPPESPSQITAEPDITF